MSKTDPDLISIAEAVATYGKNQSWYRRRIANHSLSTTTHDGVHHLSRAEVQLMTKHPNPPPAVDPGFRIESREQQHNPYIKGGRPIIGTPPVFGEPVFGDPVPTMADLPKFATGDGSAHYGNWDIVDFIDRHELSFCLGNVVKYIVRKPKNSTRLQDLLKARKYLDREIELEQQK